jgi:hypothetical protein
MFSLRIHCPNGLEQNAAHSHGGVQSTLFLEPRPERFQVWAELQLDELKSIAGIRLLCEMVLGSVVANLIVIRNGSEKY